MPSTGEPMKIQTYETKMLLDKLGGYISDIRKGKGGGEGSYGHLLVGVESIG
jgi:hypothetical protein